MRALDHPDEVGQDHRVRGRPVHRERGRAVDQRLGLADAVPVAMKASSSKNARPFAIKIGMNTSVNAGESARTVRHVDQVRAGLVDVQRRPPEFRVVTGNGAPSATHPDSSPPSLDRRLLAVVPEERHPVRRPGTGT